MYLSILNSSADSSWSAPDHEEASRVAVAGAIRRSRGWQATQFPLGKTFYSCFFDPSPESQAAGRAFWDRRHERTADVDPPSSPQAPQAQTTALRAWFDDGPNKFDELTKIAQPTLVMHGHRDIMLPTVNAYNLSQSQHIPEAQLIIYPRSGHGALFQYPTLFVRHVQLFLDGEDPWLQLGL